MCIWGISMINDHVIKGLVWCFGPYLSNSEHTEEGRVAGIQALQLHPHLEAVPALWKRLVLQHTHKPGQWGSSLAERVGGWAQMD